MKKLINNSEGRTLANTLYQRTYEFFKKEENIKAFIEWYRNTYGKDYDKRGIADE